MVDLVGAADALRANIQKKCVGLARKAAAKADLAAVEGKNSQLNSESLRHRTAFAATGNGALYYDFDVSDPNGADRIGKSHLYIFTKWGPTAADDMAALRSRFDTNGDGKLTGTELTGFKVMETLADGRLISRLANDG